MCTSPTSLTVSRDCGELTFRNTWEHIWEVCKRVDRPNFGLCLDTFRICGTHPSGSRNHPHLLTGDATHHTDHVASPAARAYADPTSRNGLVQDPPEGSAVLHLSSSLKKLATTVPLEKIFYFQVSDGSRKVTPEGLLQAAKDQGIGPLYAWSNAWRPLPYMDEVCPRTDGEGWGGYLPVLDVCEAVLKTGWRGPWSYEVCAPVNFRRHWA